MRVFIQISLFSTLPKTCFTFCTRQAQDDKIHFINTFKFLYKYEENM